MMYSHLALTLLLLVSGLTVEEPSAAKQNLGGVRGIVFDADGRPIEGISVYASRYGKPPKGRPHAVLTDKKGRFYLDSVDPGRTIIHAVDNERGYEDKVFSFYVDADSN